MSRIAAGTATATPEDGATPAERIPAAPGATGPTRRRVVTTTALGALAATALAACGGGDEDPIPTTQPSAGDTGSASAGGSAGAEGEGGVIAKVADVPVGGAINGTTPDGTKVILSQPQAGTVVAFDSRCPHQGCTVAPANDRLQCPCHGSAFKTEDGSVIHGPATKGLRQVPVTVNGDDIIAG
jgi:Rieske Fe-S protein